MTDDVGQSPIRLWVSEHNGWEAWVAQHDDGTFTAWACRTTENAVALYVEDNFEHACAAALFDLARLSDHDTCEPTCTGWHERPALSHHQEPQYSTEN
jgi:hypothetical protein